MKNNRYALKGTPSRLFVGRGVIPLRPVRPLEHPCRGWGGL
jgi:hypothetical protein